MEYSKEQLFWAFAFLSAVLWARVLQLKRMVESKTRYSQVGHGRTVRIGCAGLVMAKRILPLVGAFLQSPS